MFSEQINSPHALSPPTTLTVKIPSISGLVFIIGFILDSSGEWDTQNLGTPPKRSEIIISEEVFGVLSGKWASKYLEAHDRCVKLS